MSDTLRNNRPLLPHHVVFGGTIPSWLMTKPTEGTEP